VVGVAKRRFAGAAAIELHRGTSHQPLMITAAGIDPAVAAQHVAAMHGPHRLPTIITLADQLGRGLVSPT
jgi:deoxyribonuclease V